MKELRGFLAWSAVVFGPVVLVLVLAAQPFTADYAGFALFGLVALLLVAGLVRRDNLLAVPVVLLLFQAVMLPQMSMLFRLARMSATMGPLTGLRERVDAYEKKRGRPPASLAELGPVPPVEIWARDASGRSHYHAPSNAVQTLTLPASYEDGSAPAGLRDAGGYAYDPASGRVILACTGLDPKLRRPFYRK